MLVGFQSTIFVCLCPSPAIIYFEFGVEFAEFAESAVLLIGP